MNNKNRPKVGMAVHIFNDKGEILIGKRKGSHGTGSWCVPGGHLEFGEDFEDCLRRETREEANIEIKDIKFVAVTNDIFENENKHYITLFFTAKFKSGKVKINEPDKCEEWKWVKWKDFPKDLFLSEKNLRKQIDELIP